MGLHAFWHIAVARDTAGHRVLDLRALSLVCDGAASAGGEVIIVARSSQPRDHITAENPTENARRRATPPRTTPRSRALCLCTRRPTPRWKAEGLSYRPHLLRYSEIQRAEELHCAHARNLKMGAWPCTYEQVPAVESKARRSRVRMP